MLAQRPLWRATRREPGTAGGVYHPGIDPTTALYCYDGSAASRIAVERAGKLLRDRPGVVLCVWQAAVEMGSGMPFGATPYDNVSLQDIEAIDRAVQQRAADVAKEGCDLLGRSGISAQPATAMAASGVWRAILDIADQHDVAVIVAGSRGLSGITSLVLGSVSHGLANHAHRPLLIVPVAQD
jgi:nucleotide-binding universal stress UspA family protein